MKWMIGATCSIKVQSGNKMIWVEGMVKSYIHQSNQYVVDSDDFLYYCSPHEIVISLAAAQSNVKLGFDVLF